MRPTRPADDPGGHTDGGSGFMTCPLVSAIRSGQLSQRDQWQCAGTQHDVVEAADVEHRSLALAGFLAQREDLQLPELVGQRLPRPRQVAVDLPETASSAGNAVRPR